MEFYGRKLTFEIVLCSELLDIDFGNASRQSEYAIPVNVNPSLEIRYRWLDDEGVSLSKEMLRSLGMALGTKRGSIMVDCCIANFYEANMHQMPLVADAYLEWLHGWIGSLALAKEVSVLLSMSLYLVQSFSLLFIDSFFSGLTRTRVVLILLRSKRGDESACCNRWHRRYFPSLSTHLYGVFQYSLVKLSKKSLC